MVKKEFADSAIQFFWKDSVTVKVTELTKVYDPTDLKDSDIALAEKLGKEMDLLGSQVIGLAGEMLFTDIRRKEGARVNPIEEELLTESQNMVSGESHSTVGVFGTKAVLEQITTYCRARKSQGVTKQSFYRLALKRLRDYRRKVAKKALDEPSEDNPKP